MTQLECVRSIVSICAMVLANSAFAASTERVSVSSVERQALQSSSYPAVSQDGRFVVFESTAANLVNDDTNGVSDVFVRNLRNGTTERISTSSAGEEGDKFSGRASISANGRFVSFYSCATNLVEEDLNDHCDIFVRDRKEHTTALVSISTDGVQGDRDSGGFSSIGANGRVIAFESTAGNLAPEDIAGNGGVFVRDMIDGTTDLVSKSSAGIAANTVARLPLVAGDGRFVFFESGATNLVIPNDIKSQSDIFVRDRDLGTTEKVSVNLHGEESASVPGESRRASISADGRFVAFVSNADDLVASDTNGVDDIFVRDLVTNTTARAHAGKQGGEPYDPILSTSISGDGRFVTFSFASGVANDQGVVEHDIFVRDLHTAILRRVNVTNLGRESRGVASEPGMSSDGRFVAFLSDAPDLIEHDTNEVPDIFLRDFGPVSQSRNELLADLGPKGLWQRSSTGVWARIDRQSPIAIAAADLDGSFTEDVVASFPGRGLFSRYNNRGDWNRLNASPPSRVVSGDFDGNNVADLAADFGARGLLAKINEGSWSRWGDASDGLAACDLNGDGKDELIVDRGGARGLWLLHFGRPWIKIHSWSPSYLATGDLNGDGQCDVIADFGSGRGILVRRGGVRAWHKVAGLSSHGLATGDLDGNGKDEIIAALPHVLRARFNDTGPWFTLDTRSPSHMVILDLDHNGEDDIVAGFPGEALSARYNNSGAWTLLRAAIVYDLAAGAFQ